MLLVVLECFKDRAFHIETVYVNLLDPSRGCTLQAELIGTTSLEPSGSDSSLKFTHGTHFLDPMGPLSPKPVLNTAHVVGQEVQYHDVILESYK